MDNPYEPPKSDERSGKSDDRTELQKFASGCVFFFVVAVAVMFGLWILMFVVCYRGLG